MNIKLPVIIVLILAFGFAACKKNDDVPDTDSILTTNLKVINATADTLNFYLNGTRINNTSSLYPYGSTAYTSVPFGEHNYEFKKFGSPVVLFTSPLTLDTGKNYSLFIAGSSNDEALLTIDTLATADDAARVRFVHTSPDAGDLDVAVGSKLKFRARAFKTVTVFLNVDEGVQHIRIYKAGTSTLLSDQTQILETGRVYTLFLKGVPGGLDDAKFGAGLSVNR